MSQPSQPSADTSVRIAWAADAPEVARVQVAAWRQAYADLLPAEVLDQLDENAFAEQWQRSLAQPPDARHRLLVALDHQQVVGFAATGPAEDPDADPIADGTIAAFHIDPTQTRHGHGSRLLQACVDTLVADNFRRAVIWLLATDDVLRKFLTEAGWGPDRAHRELDLYGDGSVRAKQIRLHTALVDD